MEVEMESNFIDKNALQEMIAQQAITNNMEHGPGSVTVAAALTSAEPNLTADASKMDIVDPDQSSQTSLKELEVKLMPVLTRTTKIQNVPAGQKDEKYWEKRLKNIAATRHSRYAKKEMMDQLVKRIKFLEEACADLEEKIRKKDLE